jgi:hypothetical protein
LDMAALPMFNSKMRVLIGYRPLRKQGNDWLHVQEPRTAMMDSP